MSQNQEQPQAVHHVASLDFDKCFMRADKTRVRYEEFTVEFRKHGKGIERLYLGTSRNSRKVESQSIAMGAKASYSEYTRFAKSYNRESGYETVSVEAYGNELSHNYMTLSTVLMEDVYRRRKPGTTFRAVEQWVQNNAIEENYQNNDGSTESLAELNAKKSPVIPGFSTKVDILYKQMHDASHETKGEPIVFHFYDDSERILKALQEFYSTNTALIPVNISLMLHCVKAGVITDYAEAIKGTNDSERILGSSLVDECVRAGLKAAIKACAHDHLIELDKDPNSAEAADQEAMHLKTTSAFAEAVVKAEKKLMHAGKHRLPPMIGTVAGYAVAIIVGLAACALIPKAEVVWQATDSIRLIAMLAVCVLTLAVGTVSSVYLRRHHSVRKHSFLRPLPKQEGNTSVEPGAGS